MIRIGAAHKPDRLSHICARITTGHVIACSPGTFYPSGVHRNANRTARDVTRLVSVFVCLLYAPVAAAGADTEAASTVRLSGGPSYTAGWLDWNIAGDINAGSPSVLSELLYDALQGVGATIGISVDIDRLQLVGATTLNLVVAGNVQDSDYAADEREDEFSRKLFGAGVGSGIGSWSMGVLTPLVRLGSRGSISAYGGYGANRQTVRMIGATSVIPASGLLSVPDSVYSATWVGPMGGFQVDCRFGGMQAGLHAIYHRVSYSADADWGPRTDLAHPLSFTHEALGNGYAVSAEMGIPVNELTFRASAGAQYYVASTGVDTTYTSSGGLLRTRLNQVRWRAFFVTATFGH